MNNLKKIIFFTLIIFSFLTKGSAAIKDALFAIVGDKPITTYDIIEEIKVILILTNQNIVEESREQLEATAIKSVVKRTIKQSEIDKYGYNSFNKADLNKEIKIMSTKLGLDVDTFKNVFETNEINFSRITDRVKTELLWNGLIFQIYNDRISINIDEINDQIKLIKNKKEIEEYLVSEIIIKPVASNKIDSEIEKLKNKIKLEGFENVARNLSISETSVRGGDLGWINENIISKNFKSNIINTPVGSISEPIILSEGILLFKIRDKRKIDNILNIEDIKKQIVNAEKTKILNMHSLSHYDRIRRSMAIKYFNE